MSILSRNKLQFFFTTPGHIFLIIVGILLRFHQYLFNRSLWLDEVALAQSIVNRSYLDLLKPLEYDQLAPVGFLWASRFFVELLGPSEYSLRLFSFICGALCVVLFYFVCRLLLDSKATTFALALFALHGQLIYFSSEVKPYICDVFACLTIFYLTLKIIRHTDFKVSSFLGLGILGAVAIWFSYPVIFVLAASFVLLGFVLFKKDQTKSILILIPVVIWFLSFYAFYTLTKNNFSGEVDQLYHNYWGEYFVPLIPTSPWQLQALISHLLGFFKDPGGFYFVGIALFLSVLGFAALYKRNRHSALLLVLPILFTLMASGFKKYPFAERLILFLVPSLILLVAEGINALREYRFVVRLMLILVFLHPALSVGYHLVKPRTREEIRPVLKYLSQELKPGDHLYVEYFGHKTLKFYAGEFQISLKDWIVGNKSHEFKEFIKDAENFKGKSRVWILYPHLRYLSDGLNEDLMFLSYLDTIGKRELELEIPGVRYMFYEGKTVGSAVYLYNFAQK